MIWPNRLFLSMSSPPRGGIFGTYSLTVRDLPRETVFRFRGRLFLSLSVPPRGGIFALWGVRAVAKLAARAVFFCPFGERVTQFAFSNNKNFRSEKIFLSPEYPPARRADKIGSSYRRVTTFPEARTHFFGFYTLENV